MRATWLALLLLLGLALPAGAQGPTPVGTTQGRVLLTLQDGSGQPVGGVEVLFLSEQQVALASCVTDGMGRCTMELTNAPADASGFIRGSLAIEGRGRRPVIWPGSDFPLTITLDEAGQLDVPLDLYVTRTPAPTSIYPTVTPRGAATATAQASMDPASAPADLATAIVPASTTPISLDEPASPSSFTRYWPLILIALLLAAVVTVAVIVGQRERGA